MSDDRRDARAEAAAEKARAKALRPWYKKKRFAIPLALVVLLVVIAVASPKDEAEKVGTADTVPRSEDTSSTSAASGTVGSTAATQPAKTSFGVGDIVKRENLELTVLQANPNFTGSNEFLKPKPGNKIVGVELQVKNNGKESEAISTLLQMKLKDSTNAQYDITFGGGGEPAFPDGELAAADTARGWVGFETPAAAKGLRFIFDASVFGSGQIFWDLGI